MKIFRKTRLKLLGKNSFSKYFIYAIGEIILVVIGILIALYLNNKKDESDLYEKQKTHFTLIKNELISNLQILDEEDEDLSKIIKNLRMIINLSNSEVAIDTINEIELSGSLFLPLTRAIDLNYENGAFIEFVNSNGLKDVKNDNIKTILSSWEKQLKTLDLQESVVKKSLAKAVDFIEINGSVKTIFDNYNLSETYLEVKNSPILISNKNILTSTQFENILLQYLGVATQLHKKTYPKFKDQTLELISLIEQELKID